MNKSILERMLVDDEGIVLHPYNDTVGKLTIGVGRNLKDVGITEKEAVMLLRNDIDRVTGQLETQDVYNGLNEARQTVLANMCFNLGYAGIMKFGKMWSALARGDYASAANEMLDSKWAMQVGKRANRLAEMMSTGEYIEV